MSDIPGDTKRLVLISLRLKIIIASFTIPTVAVAAYLAFDPYVPVLKSQVINIIDERTSLQTKVIKDTIGIPVASLIVDVKTILQDNAVGKCERAKENHDRISQRAFDLERIIRTSQDDEARRALELRLVVVKNDEVDAKSKFEDAKEQMRKLTGRSC